MNPALSWAIVCGIGLGVGLWTLASMIPALNRTRLAKRIAPYLLDVSPAAREMMAPPPPGPLPVLGALIEPFAARGRAILSGALGGAEDVGKRLRQSGSTLTTEAFRSQQLVWGLVASGVGVAITIVASRTQAVPLLAHVCAAAVFFAAGVVARDQLLQRAARRRARRLASELPLILEFLTLSLSAGEGILDAIRRVGRVSAGELAGELQSVVLAVSTGLPFGETLSALARDLDLPAFSRCVEQLVGALERGTPLAEVLRAQAQDSRDDSKRELLEVAGKKEIAMMVPLVFLILPVTILFAVFPGVFVLQMGF